MKDHTVISIDVAKNKLQVGVKNKHGKLKSNKPKSRTELKTWLANQLPCTVVMESCAGSNYWGRLAQSLGHEVRMLPAKQVKPFRTGQKTDANDVKAILAANESVNVKPSRLLTIEDQGMQSIDKIRSLLDCQKTQLSNQIRGLLLEFGIVICRGSAAMRSGIPDILESADNGMPPALRDSVSDLWEYYGQVELQLAKHDHRLRQCVEDDHACGVMMRIEGIGPIGAGKLKMQLSQDHYNSGRHAAACIGVTPTQHSSGDTVKMGGIRKVVCDQSLRSTLFLGARSVVSKLKYREARTEKERWIKALMARRGVKCASIALVNKNIRTAYALLKHNREYRVTPLAA